MLTKIHIVCIMQQSAAIYTVQHARIYLTIFPSRDHHQMHTCLHDTLANHTELSAMIIKVYVV